MPELTPERRAIRERWKRRCAVQSSPYVQAELQEVVDCFDALEAAERRIEQLESVYSMERSSGQLAAVQAERNQLARVIDPRSETNAAERSVESLINTATSELPYLRSELAAAQRTIEEHREVIDVWKEMFERRAEGDEAKLERRVRLLKEALPLINRYLRCRCETERIGVTCPRCDLAARIRAEIEPKTLDTGAKS